MQALPTPALWEWDSCNCSTKFWPVKDLHAPLSASLTNLPSQFLIQLTYYYTYLLTSESVASCITTGNHIWTRPFLSMYVVTLQFLCMYCPISSYSKLTQPTIWLIVFIHCPPLSLLYLWGGKSRPSHVYLVSMFQLTIPLTAGGWPYYEFLSSPTHNNYNISRLLPVLYLILTMDLHLIKIHRPINHSVPCKIWRSLYYLQGTYGGMTVYLGTRKKTAWSV